MSIWMSHRVSYGETDAMGVMYYAEYFHLFERGRSHWIRCHGQSYAQIEGQGIFLPVREARCRYRAPAHYDDLLWLETQLVETGRASLVFCYHVMDQTRTRLIAEGSTQHAVVDATGKPTALPGWLREFLHREVTEQMPPQDAIPPGDGQRR